MHRLVTIRSVTDRRTDDILTLVANHTACSRSISTIG